MKFLKSVVVQVLVVALCACSTERSMPTGIAKPAQLRMLDSSILSVDVRINDSDVLYQGEQLSDGSWIVELDITLGVEYSFVASWYANVDGNRLMLLEQRGNFFADAETQTGQANIDSDLSEGGVLFNADCDDLTNLAELQFGSNPLEPDTCAENPLPDPPVIAPQLPDNNALPPSKTLPDMIKITGGEFLMGSPDTDEFHNDDERQHTVSVDSFYIGIYEVTNDQYAFFANQPGIPQSPPSTQALGSRPRTKVSWQDVVAYTDWLTRNTGDTYRLPTEAEWEYAARAGTTTPFWTGETIRGDQENMNSEIAYGGGVPIGFRWGGLLEVGSLQPNPWRLYDMLGNAREYTCSVYDANYENGNETRCNDDDSQPRVLRGGADYSDAQYVRVYFRNRLFQIPADEHSGELGFRVVREIR